MALITDPDSLVDSAADDASTEVDIDTTAKTITLNIAGNLSTDGVTIKALYSFLKEEWKNDPNTKNLPAFPFPMVPITDEAFELVDGWDFEDDTARYLIRTGGWTAATFRATSRSSGRASSAWVRLSRTISCTTSKARAPRLTSSCRVRSIRRCRFSATMTATECSRNSRTSTFARRSRCTVASRRRFSASPA